MPSEPAWELYRSFLAVLREGSLSGAARQLGLTQPTLGRHIDQLQEALGLVLFTRAPQGLVPTAAALQIRPHAQAMAAAAEALLREASGELEGPSGTVRITASEVVGAEVLPPILTALRRDHPRVELELVLTNVTEDLVRREADIAVRMVQPTQTALVTRRLGSIELGFHAREDYLARAGTPGSMEELVAGHTLIGFDRETASIRAIKAKGLRLSRDLFALRTDSDLAQLAAIRAGFGVGVCQVQLARRDPRLVRLLPEDFHLGLDVWLTMHEDLRSSRRVRVVYDHLAEGLTRYIEG